jgi:hypothetical protein
MAIKYNKYKIYQMAIKNSQLSKSIPPKQTQIGIFGNHLATLLLIAHNKCVLIS